MIESLGQMLTDSNAWWTIAVGAFSSTACGLLGCYLVLRRLSLIGDAISHAVLPGLVLAYLWTGARNPLPMVAGAMVMGVVTALLTQTLHRLGRVPTDSSMGVVFTSLFAIGVILITRYADQIDLDPGCVLYGLIEFVPIDTLEVAGQHIPRAFLVLGGMLVMVLIFIFLFWKELKICAFDPELATTMGVSAGLIHYVLMAMVAATTVTSFEAVGSILVIAMLIVPGATAHLLTDRLGRMMWISTAVSVSASFFGYWGAVWLNTSVAGMIACAAGAQFTLALFFAPRHGIASRMLHNLLVGLRVVREDVLLTLWRRHEREAPAGIGRRELIESTGGGWMARLSLGWLRRAECLTVAGDRLTLTEKGRAAAGQLIRGHRLWEAYQTEMMGRQPDAVHASAHQLEHFLTAETTERLAETLHEPQTDPHGRKIPR